MAQNPNTPSIGLFRLKVLHNQLNLNKEMEDSDKF